MKRTIIDRTATILYIAAMAVYAVSIIYMHWFMTNDKALPIPREEVQVIREWTYTDQLTGPEKITSPTRVEKDGRDTFVFEGKIPDSIPEGSVLAILNRVNFTAEIDGRILRKWDPSEAPIIGGTPKNSYFFVPLRQDDAGKTIKLTFKSDIFGGKMFDAFVGNRYEVVRYLELKNGAFQFAMSLVLLVCSLGIIIAGLVLKILFNQRMKLVLISMGIFVTSSWMVADSFVFQFIFRIQFIDGLMSYMTTLSIIFPFIAYLNSIQEYRYRKWYLILTIVEFLNMMVFTGLHISGVYSFAQSLLWLDIVLGVGVLGCMVLTIVDIVKGNSAGYRFVAYGFLCLMILTIIEIVLINTVVERVEGGVIIAGLYILFVFAIIQQLVEIRQIGIERDRANEEGAAKTRFLASMSHEIRTPINSILGMNEMIMKETRDPDILNYAGIINDSGTMLLSLINDVLDVSKIENDMEEIVCANYDPGRMFDAAAEVLRTGASKKELAVKIGKPRNLPKVLYGDEKRILQIVTNLITNAVKYTEEGTVTFTGECFEQSDGYVLCFYVSDTGMGIKEEDMDGIFDPFHRLELRKNQNIQGTGLGLSIVKSLVEKMNGEINVESTYGKGSTFSVRLPQKAKEDEISDKFNSGNAVEDDDLSDIDPNYIAPEARVLEVDDNRSNQVVVREFLKATGVQLDIASGGTEALKLCKVNRYDVILMDHMMPHPDGIETLHMIRSDEGGMNASTPVVILTANALRGSRAEYEAEGFDNYLSKPVESARLLKMVRKYLPPDKVMYKPKKRTPISENGPAPDTPGTALPADGPVDIPALLARFDNKEETVSLILEEVIKEGERKIPLLRQLAESGDIKRYAVEAHGVKGVMSSTCVPSLSDTAKRHELAAKEGNAGYVNDNLESFLAEYEQVLEYIREYLKGRKT